MIPRGMREPMAAEYIGLSVTALRRTGVKSVQLTPGRIVYLREDLDAFLDRAAGKQSVSDGNEWLTAF